MPQADCTPMLKALADESRWRIVQHLLLTEQAKVTALAAALQLPQPSVSKHLRILRNAGIVTAERQGTSVWCSILPAFRQQLTGSGTVLDLGCCTFRFEGGVRPKARGKATSEARAW